MSTRSLSASRFSVFLLAAATSMLFALPALATSQARIVRLSDVQGRVQIDKNTGLGFENAFVNLPITQGTQVRTSDNGRAEVEFEDGSSMRLAPNTTVEFSTLGLSDSGVRISQVNLVEGMAYVNWMGKGSDDFSLSYAREKVSIDHPAHFRVDTSSEVANLAVFKGDVDVEGPSGKLTVEKKKTATCESQDDKCQVEDKIAEATLDSWDKEASSYHDQYAKNNTSPYGYGASDLNYYGAYSTVPGYGTMWQPYFTGVGWDPFMDGAWGFYPGYGYMFASAYPWGWLPYRYGNWNFIPGYGWGWQPGGWNNVLSVPRYSAAPTVHVTALTPPVVGTTRTVLVGRGGAVSTLSPHVVNAGSAGLGIARGSLGNLGHLNHQVAKSGFAEVRPAPQFRATSPGGTSGSGQGRSSASSGSATHSSPSFHSSSGSTGGHTSAPSPHH
jgi:FecR protein